MLTTTIGSFPKPAYVPVRDWFQAHPRDIKTPIGEHEAILNPYDDATVKRLLDRATWKVMQEQVQAGIDIPTDGEVRRENYIHYHCRHLEGIDFTHLTERTMRAGTWQSAVPTIVGPIKAGAPFLSRDWRVAQDGTTRPVKITLPGPMTIADSVADAYYGDTRRLGEMLAGALNTEIQALAASGCQWVQVDEPVLARYPEQALAYGIDHIERCFHGVDRAVTRVVHVCCGYPDRLDYPDYPKADPHTYFRLAAALDAAQIDVVSIEDAHRPNDLGLLEQFAQTMVMFGTIDIASNRVESVDEIASRLTDALDHINDTRLIVAPDCGLGMLRRETAVAKLTHMVQAARMIRTRPTPRRSDRVAATEGD